jgi:predicted membrane chloride channel (bestrophin family)
MAIINRKNIWLIFRSLILVLLIMAVKTVVHSAGFEIITASFLFSGIIAANVFLMGFLLSGVLSDYKESEKIPGELAASLSSIYDEILSAVIHRKSRQARPGLKVVHAIALDIEKWLHRKIRTRGLLVTFRSLDGVYHALEKVLPPNYLVRLKSETAHLKKTIIRTDTIRDTNFISSGYIIASIVTILMCLGLILLKIDPFYESLFFVGVISYLMIFLLLLIHDLDNPFGYSERRSAENVSLYPLSRIIEEMKETNRQYDVK